LFSDLYILVLSLFAFFAVALTSERVTRQHYLQILEMRMRGITWNLFPINNLLMESNPSFLRRHVTCIQIRASLNHRKKKKAETSRLIY